MRAGRWPADVTTRDLARWEGEGGSPPGSAAVDASPAGGVDPTSRIEQTVRPQAATLLRREKMLQTLAIVLLILWLLGTVSSYTMGGFIHILLVVAIVMFLVRLVQGRRLV